MLIGVAGKLGSGKDSFAEILIKHLDDINITAERKSFAYKLKQVVALLTGTDISIQLSQEGKKIIDPIFNMSYGEMQQKIGTDAMRNGLVDDVWIKSLFADYKPKDYVEFKTERIPFETNLHKIIGTPLGYEDKIGDTVPHHKAIAYSKNPVYPVWIISDVRFKNEAQAIIDKGGFLVRMEGDPAGVRANSNRDLTHPSETDLDDFKGFHFTIYNDKDHGWISMQQHAEYLAQLCYTGKESI
jgi:hypothetical protein